MEKMYDVIIIGSGPAGLSAAIYAQRAKLSSILIEANYMSGGQMVNTYEVDNYPGLPGISGMDLGSRMREHAEKMGAVFVQERAQELRLEGEIKNVITNKQEYRAKTVLLATCGGGRCNFSGKNMQRGVCHPPQGRIACCPCFTGQIVCT